MGDQIVELSCLPLIDENYELSPELFSGCCTMGSILAVIIPVVLCVSLCPFVVFCFRVKEPKWKCSILPGFFLVWVLTLILFFAIFFGFAFDGVSVFTRYKSAHALLCGLEIQDFSCSRGDATKCYRLNVWLSYYKEDDEEQEVIYTHFQDFVSTSQDVVWKKYNRILGNDHLVLYYDPLLPNVVSLEHYWGKADKIALFSSGLALFGWLVDSAFLFYFYIYPTIKGRVDFDKIGESLEMHAV